ncbi:ABC protein, sub ABCG [Dermatophagoides farinae]|uniref:ABC protein, sub ABCG n=1 Tax=Dermatophagoides farinae TaxID=6954 RepID=A0A922HTP4_DERFA|nr:ABC protein, sub ABCG [Dermatophagoides farinae]
MSNETDVCCEFKKPISLCWKNLRYEVDEWCMVDGWQPRRRRKVILNRLNGSVRMNSLNALLGPSGSGKTSLINCLIGNVPAKNISPDTEIYINSEIITKSSNSLVSFVPQFVHEIILGRFTVLETLYYAFCFKNPARYHGRAYQHIQSTIQELMLNPKVLQTRFENCSGGEQRRVAIAQELMSIESKPPFLFIDEPTTGLDSESALVVMKCLQRLSTQNGITVLVSIHAPSSDILDMFDQLYIIAKGGVCIYSDQPGGLRSHLNQITGIALNGDDSPIQEYLRIASNGINDEQVRKLTQESVQQGHQRLTAQFSKFEKEECPFASIPKGIPHYSRKFRSSDLWTQFRRLLRLTFIADVRNIILVIVSSTINIILLTSIANKDMVIPSGCLPFNIEQFNQTCQEKLKEDRLIGTCLMLLIMIMILTLSLGLGMYSIMIVNFMKILRNEYRNGWYSFASLIHPVQLNDMITSILIVLIFIVIYYLNCGILIVEQYQINWYRMGSGSLFTLVIVLYGQSFGYLLIATCIDQFELLLLLSQVILVILSASNGLIVTIDLMDKPFHRTISHLLGSRYIADGYLYTYYGIDRCDPQTEYSQILKQFFVDTDHVYSNLEKPMIVIIVIRIISIIVMRWTFNNVNNGKIVSETKQEILTKILTPAIEIDFHEKPTFVQIFDSINNNIEPEMTKNEFQQFCTGRYIIGWRQLTLFATDTIYEVRPTPESLDDLGDKLILRNLSGQFQFGTLNAIMGSSGSGKTSLLKVFNGKMKTKLTGSTQFYLSRFVPIRTCYIKQEVSKHLIPGFTSKQSLVYASKLKNCHETQAIDHEQVADNLLKELDMTNTTNTLVQNCSGGERKRLALTMELTSVRMPNLICIDEPVSGLDSNSALLVLRCLRRFIARHPDITMLVSIHQPSTEQLDMFDLCYVLAFDGLGIYSGPPARIKSFLSETSSIDKDKRFPIETLIRYSCTDHSNSIVQRLAEETDNQINKITPSVLLDTVHIKDGVPFPRMRFSLRSVAILFHRLAHCSIRYQWPLWLTYLIFYVFLGTMFLVCFDKKIVDIDGCISIEDDFLAVCSNFTDHKWKNDFRLVSNVNFVIFSSFIFFFILDAQIINLFSLGLKFFATQHLNGWYTCGSYYLSKLLFDATTILPMVIIFAYVIDNYSTVSPNNFFWWQVINLYLSSLCFLAIMNMNVLFLHRSILALFTFVGFSQGFFLLLSNVYNVIEEMNFIVRFLSNFSIYRYQFQATLWLIYGGDRCKSHEIQSLMYMLNIPTNVEYFYDCIVKLVLLVIFYHTMALLVFCVKYNPLINRHERAERIERYRNEHILKIEPKHLF